MKLSCRSELIKEAQLSPAQRTANSLFKIIQFLFYRVPLKNRRRYLSRVRGKVIKMVPSQMGIKKMPPASVIGQSVAITKNILSGLNPSFINEVLIELTNILARGQEF